jgi:hypothetical protein
LTARDCGYAIKVGYWSWLPLKAIAAACRRWQPVAPGVTGHETCGHPGAAVLHCPAKPWLGWSPVGWEFASSSILNLIADGCPSSKKRARERIERPGGREASLHGDFRGSMCQILSARGNRRTAHYTVHPVAIEVLHWPFSAGSTGSSDPCTVDCAVLHGLLCNRRSSSPLRPASFPVSPRHRPKRWPRFATNVGVRSGRGGLSVDLSGTKHRATSWVH